MRHLLSPYLDLLPARPIVFSPSPFFGSRFAAEFKPQSSLSAVFAAVYINAV
jgi:hypothetical protein